MSIDELIQLLLGPASSLVLSFVIIFTGLKKKWIFYYLHEQMNQDLRDDRDEWKEAALRGSRIAERAAIHAEKVMDVVQEK